jgi:hypothetical protein
MALLSPERWHHLPSFFFLPLSLSRSGRHAQHPVPQTGGEGKEEGSAKQKKGGFCCCPIPPSNVCFCCCFLFVYSMCSPKVQQTSDLKRRSRRQRRKAFRIHERRRLGCCSFCRRSRSLPMHLPTKALSLCFAFLSYFSLSPPSQSCVSLLAGERAGEVHGFVLLLMPLSPPPPPPSSPAPPFPPSRSSLVPSLMGRGGAGFTFSGCFIAPLSVKLQQQRSRCYQERQINKKVRKERRRKGGASLCCTHQTNEALAVPREALLKRWRTAHSMGGAVYPHPHPLLCLTAFSTSSFS